MTTFEMQKFIKIFTARKKVASYIFSPFIQQKYFGVKAPTQHPKSKHVYMKMISNGHEDIGNRRY